MNMVKRLGVLAIGVALLGTAYATITFDAQTGFGFVGKGDVQFTLGWNNATLQTNADLVQFGARSEVGTEVSWQCTNSNNENIQQRERTTTTTIEGVMTSVGRERKQITGFNLLGYDGNQTEGSETEGPPVNSCPSGPWSLTSPAGDPVVVSATSGLEVLNPLNGTWTELLQKP